METSTPTASLGQGLRVPGWAEMWSWAMGTLWPQGGRSGALQTRGALTTMRKEEEKDMVR